MCIDLRFRLKDSDAWLSIGPALGSFVCPTVFVLGAAAPSMGGASGLARSVGKSVDSILFPKANSHSPFEHD